MHLFRLKISINQHIKNIVFITLGVLMASIGLKGFLLPNEFLDGGAMGVSLMGNLLFDFNLSILIIVVNLPFIFLGYQQVSRLFAFKSTIAIIVLAVLVHYIEIPMVTTDKLLIAVFGGFFLGAGIGLSIRGGSVIDGTEVLAIMVSRKSSLSVGDVIAIFNVLLFSLAAVLINIEVALYSMLTYLAASKTVDFILNGIEEYIGVFIISEKNQIIKESIINDLGRGITAFKSGEGYGSNGVSRINEDILFCAITRLEVTNLINHIEQIDPDVFIIQYPLKDARGGMIKRRSII
ncbi:MAG: YitT family protein [Flavobacteriales bacterium]|nr:YitT family protein [Flavobacteriales bacterium]